MTAYDSLHGETVTDTYGNVWTCDVNIGLWLDKYNNSTGYHPSNIGSARNPLASQDGQLWEHDGNLWISNTNINQAHYPGSPDQAVVSAGKKVLRDPPFECKDEKYIRIACRRLERQACRPGFGNARTVRTFFDGVRERQARRIAKENGRGCKTNDFLFTKEDLLGNNFDETQIKKSSAYRKLHTMEGMKPVKEQIELLIQLGTSNLSREEAEEPLLEVILNRVFLGNPGTGKNRIICIVYILLLFTYLFSS